MYTLGGCHDKALVTIGKELRAYLFVLVVTGLYCVLGLYLLSALYSHLLNHSENLSDFSACFENLKIIFFLHWAKLCMPVFRRACLKLWYSSFKIICKPVFNIPSIITL